MTRLDYDLTISFDKVQPFTLHLSLGSSIYTPDNRVSCHCVIICTPELYITVAISETPYSRIDVGTFMFCGESDSHSRRFGLVAATFAMNNELDNHDVLLIGHSNLPFHEIIITHCLK